MFIFFVLLKWFVCVCVCVEWERVRCCLLQANPKVVFILLHTWMTMEKLTRDWSEFLTLLCDRLRLLVVVLVSAVKRSFFSTDCWSVVVVTGEGILSTCVTSVIERLSVCGDSTAWQRSSVTPKRPIRRWWPSTGSTCDLKHGLTYYLPKFLHEKMLGDWLSAFRAAFHLLPHFTHSPSRGPPSLFTNHQSQSSSDMKPRLHSAWLTDD